MKAGEGPVHRLTPQPLAYGYDGRLPPRLRVEPGAVVVFSTVDARDGALSAQPPGSLFPLPPPTPGRGNPLTGPLAVSDTRPGDPLQVDILDVRGAPVAWTGGHTHANRLGPGRIPRSLGRSCAVGNQRVELGAGITLPWRPMVGCIGTAPASGAPLAGMPGHFGGNMDDVIVAKGASVFSPVEVDEALLFIGDVHAGQGDGELWGTAFETAAEVTVRPSFVQGQPLEWPWVRTEDRLAVMTSAGDFADARREAVEQMVRLIERRLGLEPADALALISVSDDLRVGQAFGGMGLTLRLEMPRLAGLDLFDAGIEAAKTGVP